MYVCGLFVVLFQRLVFKLCVCVCTHTRDSRYPGRSDTSGPLQLESQALGGTGN